MTEVTEMLSNSIMSTKTWASLFCVATMRLGAATACFDVLVLDADSLAPIEGVAVTGWFSNDNGWKAWTESAPTYADEEITDKYGFCHVKGETNTGKTGVNIRHPPKGYYPNYFAIRYRFTQKPLLPFTHWRPTDLVITARLQRVEHPVPLFVKRAGWKMGSDAIAKNEGEFAYDFQKGFLPPFGNGETADVVFRCLAPKYLGEGKNGRGYTAPLYGNTVVAIFQGDEANGIWVSPMPDAQAYLKIRNAPAEGYQRELSFSESTSYDLQRREGLDSNRCFCFRIRTVRDDVGKIKSALYGKIHGDIQLFMDGKDRWMQKIAGISFFYYLNPTPNDRNLEWDMKNNFCPKPGEILQPRP